MIIILIDRAELRLAPELAPELVALPFKDGGPTLRPDLGHREQLHSSSILVEAVVGFAEQSHSPSILVEAVVGFAIDGSTLSGGLWSGWFLPISSSRGVSCFAVDGPTL
jgi:hypothetical protein